MTGGEPETVCGSVTRGTIRGDETIEFLNLLIEFDRGRRTAMLVSSMHGIQTPSILQIIGRRGTISSLDRSTLQVVRHGGITQPGPLASGAAPTVETIETGGGPGDATGPMFVHFADLISGRSKEHHGATLREGMIAVAFTEALLQAAKTGQRVPVKTG